MMRDGNERLLNVFSVLLIWKSVYWKWLIEGFNGACMCGNKVEIDEFHHLGIKEHAINQP